MGGRMIVNLKTRLREESRKMKNPARDLSESRFRRYQPDVSEYMRFPSHVQRFFSNLQDDLRINPAFLWVFQNVCNALHHFRTHQGQFRQSPRERAGFAKFCQKIWQSSLEFAKFQ